MTAVRALAAVPAPLPPGTRDGGRLRCYRGAGGVPLYYRTLAGSRPEPSLVYLHGIESHGAWFLPVAQRLRARGIGTFLLDRRGAGLNREEGAPGDAESAGVLLDDVRRFRRGLARDVVLVGLSWGGKIALASAATDQERLRGLVLVTPGLASRVDLSLWDKLRLLASVPFGGRARFRVPIAPPMFTRAPTWLDYIERDPLRVDQVTGRLLLAGRMLDRTARRRLASLRIPVLLVLAGGDRIVDNGAIQALLEDLPDGVLRTRVYAGADHSVQFEHAQRLADDIAAFVEEVRT